MKNGKEGQRGFVFYSQDYFGDVAVRLMPGRLRIIWVEAFLLMDQSPRRGVLLKKNGEPYSIPDLSSLMNVPADDIEAAFAWVIREEIAVIDRASKCLSCRRMVREAAKRKINKANGKLGGNPALLHGISLAVDNSKQKDLFDSLKPSDKARARVPEPEPEPEPDSKQCSIPQDSSSTEALISLEVLPPSKSNGGRKPDEAFELFRAAHVRLLRSEYVRRDGRKDGDFVQLSILRKANGLASDQTPEAWEEAIRNYFASPQGEYTLADLCIRYPIFKNSPLNEYKVPINHRKVNGHGQSKAEQRDRNRSFSSARVLERMLRKNGNGAPH